ncbi:hypothetical protein DM860_014131 [Cuscuta australis]|uniref:RRM domain-containing protein n=1 Tax=Cuscuta australis TaxID=267555 RepID=A0A328DEN3_9ASTE|nr:hypothetical protein DM860_014131 [Cuscuta australis]
MAKKEQLKKRKLIKKSEASNSRDKRLKKNNNSRNANFSPPESDSESSLDDVQALLEPFSKDQLIALVVDASLHHPILISTIRSVADSDISHRKIFVFGLGYDSTRETLLSVFQRYGEIEDCNVVTDRVTGKCKGYAFIAFKTRKAAAKSLKEPKKKIGSRVASCQLASSGPAAPGSAQQDVSGRKIYVSNVGQDTDASRLRDFFAKFGEIESGPFGVDPHTGKWKGYALFVYKTTEDARKCLEDPYKMFEGRQLHCEKAAEGKGVGKSGGAAGITTAVVNQPFQAMQAAPDILAAMAAAQNMALLGQNPAAALLNPLYSQLIGNANFGMLNPAMGLSQAVIGSGQAGQPGMAAAGYGTSIGGLGGNTLGMLGSFGMPSGGMPLSLTNAYPNLQDRQISASAKAPRSSGFSSHHIDERPYDF